MNCLTLCWLAQYSSIGTMRKWLTSLILIVAMLCCAVGVGAHQQEGSCPMSNLPNCCKKAQSTNISPEVSMARLCCNLNCSEPGSGGSSSASNFSPQSSVALTTVIMPKVVRIDELFGRTPQLIHPTNRNPKYIQHLALLI